MHVWVLAAAIVIAGVVVAAAILVAGGDADPSGSGAADASSVPEEPMRTIEASFRIYPNTAFDVIAGTEWNRCDGEPERDGLECYGVGAGDGLDFGADVVVTNADGKKVGLGQIDETWGWKRGRTGGVCAMYWSVDGPAHEPGVLTVTFAGNPQWADDFTLAELDKKPGMLDLLGFGSINEWAPRPGC
jgi:hypothetical protein